MNNLFKIFSFVTTLLLVGTFHSCVDTDFDEPTGLLDISDENVISVADVLSNLPNSGATQLTDDILGGPSKFIKATVTADDESGNFFKVLVFQDETSALSISADQNELNAQFAEGKTVYIKLNGLYIARDAGLPRLGFAYINNRLERIPEVFVNTIILDGGISDLVIEPEQITISQFISNPNAYFNKLVELTNVEFSQDFLGQPYAIADGPDGPQSINAILQSCDGQNNEVILRNSGFSSFATQIVPGGNGSAIVIPGVFNDDLQVFIRDTEDLNLEGDRCDGSSGTGDFPENELDLLTIKNAFLDQGVDKIEEGFISGVVISDGSQSNITNRNMILQTSSAGIIIRFGSAHNYQLGEKLKINVSGRSFSEFSGATQIEGITPLLVAQEGTDALPEPVNVTIAEITADPYKYESVRILVEEATISGPTYNFNLDVTDATGTIGTFIQSFASFNGQPTPTGNVNIVAYGSFFNDPQIIINGPSDVTGGMTGGGPGGDGDVSQNFDGKNDFDPVNYEGWMNVTAVGNEPWYFRSFDDNGFAECEAFQSDDAVVESWLITPAIDTDDKSIISFETAQAFWQHQGLSVWVSPDFTDVANANWTELTSARIANSSDEQYAFIPSGDIDLKDFGSGMMRVGWKYEGTSAANTTKMRIDNVVLK